MRHISHRLHALLGLSLLATWPMLAHAAGGISIKGGMMNLWDDSQSIDGTTRSFDATSNRSFAIGWEVRRRSGAAFGMEYLNYENEFAPPTTPQTGLARTQALQFIARKYFEQAPVVHPFIGIGIGSAETRVSFDTPFSYSHYDWNLALQANAGVEFRLDRNFAMTLEVKALFVDADTFRYDPSATGAFFGLGVMF